MAKRLTAQKQKFLDAWLKSGDVAAATKIAKYSQPSNGHKILRQKDGVYIDETVRQYLAEKSGLAPKRDPRPKIELPSVIPQPVARVINLHANAEKGASVIPTLEEVRGRLWEVAGDPNTSDGPRVQALSILMKDLKEQEIPEPPSPEDVIDVVRSKLSIVNG